MLQLFGNPKRLCNGLSRRDLLHLGGLGAFGVTLGDFFHLRSLANEPQWRGAKFGQAKNCILIYKYGAPAQHETFDPKPNAPVEIQGETKPISTSVSGVQICEYLPNIAKIMDRLTIVRSLTHPYPLHGTVYAVSGIPNVNTKLEAKPRDKRQWPFIGSIVDYLEDQRTGGQLPALPRNVALPFVMGSKNEYPPLAGPYGASLGMRYDPVYTDFVPEGTKLAPEVRPGQAFHDPYLAIKPTDRLRLGGAGKLRKEISPERFASRHGLLEQFDRARSRLNFEKIETFDRHRQMAYSLLSSSKMHAALDFGREAMAMRQRYGMTLFGQSCLAARRLVEAGSKFVTVIWDAYGLNAGSWDTHHNHFPRLKNHLLPVFDHTFASLILDLEERGMLDETLVLVISEHGRTPKIESNRKGAGRDHWSRVYSQVYAGGGFGRGNVVGQSDAIGGDVADDPISPKDVLATAFHQLGIDPDTTVPNKDGRPIPITGTGKLHSGLLG